MSALRATEEATDGRRRTAPPDKQFADYLRRLEGRIAELERSLAGGIYGQIIKDAAGNVVVQLNQDGLSIYDPTGVARARLGWFTDPFDSDPTSGIQILDGNGAVVFQATDDGLDWPFIALSTRKANDNLEVTSRTFVDTFEVHIPVITHNAVRVRCVVTADAGTDGEVRVELPNLVPPQTSGVRTITGGGAGDQKLMEWKWAPDPDAWLMGAGAVMLQVQARRTAGSGSIFVYHPDYVYLLGASAMDATPDGLL